MKTLLPLLFLLLSGTGAFAQDVSQPVLNAFSASYTAEASKDYAKAIAALTPVYNQNSYEMNLRLGWLEYLSKDYTSSARYYRQAIKLKPSSIEAMLGLVNPLAAQQTWADVFATYQKILSIDPNHSLVNYRIALMYYYRKEFASAEKHLARVIDHYPFDYDIVLLSAQVKLALGKLGESKALYQRALLYNPNNQEIKNVLSKL